MHLKSIKVFCDVVAHRSFSKAAEDNGISQSAVSQTIHQLEEHIGVRLIDRSKRPFVLTVEGDCYHHGCRQILTQMDALEDEVRGLHDEVVGRVVIASIYSIGLHQLTLHLKTFLTDYPKANIKLEYQHPTRVAELVESGQIDIGFVSYPKSNRNIVATLWQEEPMVLVCAPQHPLASQKNIELQQLDHVDFVAFESNLKVRIELDKLFSQRMIGPKIAMELDNIETIKRAVEINAGVSLLPAQTVEREIQLGTLSLVRMNDFAPTRPIGIIQRRGAPVGITTRLFLETLGLSYDSEIADTKEPANENRQQSNDVPVVTSHSNDDLLRNQVPANQVPANQVPANQVPANASPGSAIKT
ncbi:LysR family transcriptional regulator [Pirellulaceae bacterium]|nr:LysR family transcriptional regulator [Pirellulaceae bacterium]